MKRVAVVLAALVACLSLMGEAVAAVDPAVAQVKSEQCVDCHKPEVTSHGEHAYHGQCAACHVKADEHAKAEVAKEEAPRNAKPQSVSPGLPEAKQCLECHSTDRRRMHFALSEHNKAGVKCRDCHGNHTPKVQALAAGMERGGKVTATCATCHQDVLAKFSMNSHHPVLEGGASCTGCHDPHGSQDQARCGDDAVHVVPPGAARSSCLRASAGRRGLQDLPRSPRFAEPATSHPRAADAVPAVPQLSRQQPPRPDPRRDQQHPGDRRRGF